MKKLTVEDKKLIISWLKKRYKKILDYKIIKIEVVQVELDHMFTEIRFYYGFLIEKCIIFQYINTILKSINAEYIEMSFINEMQYFLKGYMKGYIK